MCDSAAALSAEAIEAIPALVVATALSDLRPAVVLMLGLAPMNETDRQRDLTQLATDLARDLGQVLPALTLTLRATAAPGQPAPDALSMGAAAAAVVRPWLLAPGNAMQRSVQRMMEAAERGVKAADRALLDRIERLKHAPDARRFVAHDPATVSLDRVYDGLLAGGYAVLKSPAYTELYRIAGLAEVSRAEYAVSGKSTVLKLAGENLPLFAHGVREVSVLVGSSVLPRARTPLTRVVRGASLEVEGRIPGLQAGRRLVVQGVDAASGERVVHAAVLVAATLLADRTVLAIEPPLARALRRQDCWVFGNAALATHGETGVQLLGNGEAGRPHQRFELKRLPLTWRTSAANERGVESELVLRVNDIAWQRRESLFGAAPDERAYVLATDEQGRQWVQFGDGVQGARLPSGQNNVRASYRQGLGVEGNVPAERLTQLMSRPPGLKGVSNPAAALGGSDPEPAAKARRAMPLTTRTLGRAVSVRDYEDFALGFNGVAKAVAALLDLAGGPAVAITLAGPGNEVMGDAHPVRQRLLQALKRSGDPHVRIELLAHRASTFRLALKLRPDPTYDADAVLAAAEAALRRAFGFDARALGQPVLHSEIVAALHAVPGVTAVDIDALYGGTWPQQASVANRPRLLARAMQVLAGRAEPAELLTLDPGPLAALGLM